MIYKVVVSQFTKMLGNLLAILDETAKYADEKKFDVEDLLQFRLAPDHLYLLRHFQTACYTPHFCAALLSDTVTYASDSVYPSNTRR